MALLHKGKVIKSAGLAGFGISNKSVLKYLSARHPEISLTLRTREGASGYESITSYTGNEQFSRLTEDVVFISPAIRRDLPELQGKLLSSDAELFFEKNTNTVFALTGTDGKSTSAAISALLLKNSFHKVSTIGNIGAGMSEHLLDGKDTAYVAELSSFQLMYTSPHTKRALITNIEKNHLNWHLSYDEYIAAKCNILTNCEECVFGVDSPKLRQIAKSNPPYAVFSSKLDKDELKSYNSQTIIYIEGDYIYKNGKKVLSLDKLLRNEAHNILNFLAAIALTDGFSDTDTILQTATEFRGLEHRLETLKNESGILCYNSSIDSSPERTVQSLAAVRGGAVVLMGGRTKNKSFEILRKPLEKAASAIVLTGENRYEIDECLHGIAIPIYIEEDFDTAVIKAFSLARRCGALLFSPASVSFDAFQSFEERGRRFKDLIKKLK